MTSPVTIDLCARVCRSCDCRELWACPGGCSWVLLDIDSSTGICSACAEEMGFTPALLAVAGLEQAASPEHEQLIAFLAQASSIGDVVKYGAGPIEAAG